jgi:hypothetical protein
MSTFDVGVSAMDFFAQNLAATAMRSNDIDSIIIHQ